MLREGIRAWILGLGGILRRFPARFKHKRIRMAVWTWSGRFGLLWDLKQQNKGGVEGEIGGICEKKRACACIWRPICGIMLDFVGK